MVRFYNKRGTAEQWIKEGKQATHWTRLSCHRFRANEVRLQLSVLAYNLGNLWRRLGLPRRIKSWSLTSLQHRLMKTGGRLVKHARYYWLLLTQGHLNRRLFGVTCCTGSGRCLCQVGNGRRAATDKRRWVAEEETTRSSVGEKPSSELERGDRAAFKDRNRSERSIDREKRTKTLHPSLGLEYPNRAGMAKTEIPVKKIAGERRCEEIEVGGS